MSTPFLISSQFSTLPMNNALTSPNSRRFLISCDFNKKSDDNYVARVGEEFLSYSYLNDLITKNISIEDSVELANKIISEWATSKLLLQNAQNNLKSGLLKEEKITTYWNNPQKTIRSIEIDPSCLYKKNLFHFY